MSDYNEGLLIGSAVSWSLALIIGRYLMQREHEAWCSMFDQMFACLERLAERVSRPDDPADWWKDN